MNAEKFRAEILPIRKKLYHTACRMLEEEASAEDTVQEVFLKLWQMRDKLDSYQSVEALAVTITKNICIDTIRKRSREEPIDPELYRQPGYDDPMRTLENKSNEELIRLLVDRLPALQQMVLRLKDIEDYDLDEIAELTGTSNEAVRVNLSRARKKIREDFLRITNERKK